MPTYHTYRIFISYLFKLIFITFMKKLLLFLVGLYALFGALPTNAKIIYFNNVDNGNVWPGSIYAYFYGTEVPKGWPGYQMTKLGGNLWAIEYDNNSDYVIFNNNSGTQTGDNNALVAQNIYWQSGTAGGEYTFSVYINGTSYPMTFDNNTNTYSATVKTSKSNTTFQIHDNKGFNWFIGSSTLTDNATINVSYASNESTYSQHSLTAGTHTITWNPISKTISDVLISISEDDDNVTLSDWYLVGGFNDWSTNDTYRFTKVSENTYVITGFTALNGKSGSVDSDDGLKIKDNASNT